MNSYISTITKLYAWQFEGREEPLPLLQKMKLAAILKNIQRDEKQV